MTSPATAGLSPTDRGLTLGVGLFETVLADHGRLIDWEAHLARLARGCAVLGLPAPDAGACRLAGLRALSDAALMDQRAALRLTWTGGQGARGLDPPSAPAPLLIASAAPSLAPAGPLRLVLVETRRNETSPASRLKSLSYLDNVLARAEARRQGAEEAVMLNTRGELACAAAANLFWVARGRVFTPALDCGVLNGIVRQAVIAAAARGGLALVEGRFGPEALDEAEAVFLTNSLIGVRAAAGFHARTYEPDHALVAHLAAVAGLVS